MAQWCSDLCSLNNFDSASVVRSLPVAGKTDLFTISIHYFHVKMAVRTQACQGSNRVQHAS